MMVVRDAVRRPDGSLGTYVRTLPTNGTPGSVILPVLEEQVVLVHHFRTLHGPGILKYHVDSARSA